MSSRRGVIGRLSATPDYVYREGSFSAGARENCASHRGATKSHRQASANIAFSHVGLSPFVLHFRREAIFTHSYLTFNS